MHHYDRRNRLVRSVTTRETEWDDEQQAWALAWLMYQSLVHGPCGHYLPDSTRAQAEDGYDVDAPTRCHACTAQQRAIATHMNGPHDRHPEALLWSVQRRR